MSDRNSPDAHPRNESRSSGITVMDLLRAIFTPQDMVEPPNLAPAARPRSIPIEAPPPEAARAPMAERPPAPPAPEAPPVEQTTAAHRLALVLGTTGTLLLAYAAQRSLSVARQDTLGVMLYALAIFLWLAMLLYEFGPAGDRWAWLPRRVHALAPRPVDSDRPWLQTVLAVEPPRLYLAAAGLSLSALTYLATANNRFTFIGLVAWLGSLAIWIMTLSEQAVPPQLPIVAKARAWLRHPTLDVHAGPFFFLSLLVVLVGAIYRFHLLDMVPPEMTSDHVEKLLDAYRVQNGHYLVFFPNNGGREAIQMYWVALLAKVLGTGMSFTSLKLASGLEGLALIPAMIVLGREVIDRQTGLMAALLVALSWWHVSLSRMGLRIVLTPLVMSMVLITLLRGLRSGERRHFIAAGIWLGVGVYSYQAMRMAPLVVVAGIVLGMFRRGADWGWRRNLLGQLVITGLIALVIFVPMGRFWADNPAALWDRVVNRTTSNEIAIQGSPAGIFLANLGDAFLMFNWKGDVAWISAIPGAPLMDVVSGCLLILGVVAWAVRLGVRRDPLDGLVPAAILIMLLPSALAIAFPIENPSATRASGVIPLVYLLAAWPLTLIRERWLAVVGRPGRRLALAIVGTLVAISALFNYDAYFRRYYESYRRSALNPSEVGAVVAGFADSVGSLDNAYLQGYPFWHDYRAIGIEAGDITWDNAILDPDHLKVLLAEDPHLTDGEAKLFIVNVEDEEGQAVLAEAYPEGLFILKTSAVPDRDFYAFVVPAQR